MITHATDIRNFTAELCRLIGRFREAHQWTNGEDSQMDVHLLNALQELKGAQVVCQAQLDDVCRRERALADLIFYASYAKERFMASQEFEEAKKVGMAIQTAKEVLCTS